MNQITRKICVATLAAFAMSFVYGAEIYISPKGSDSKGDGSKTAPYASLAQACERAKQLKQTSVSSEIIALEGDYFFKSDKDTIKLNDSLSGSSATPLKIRGEGKVNFIGGVRIPWNDLKLVTDRAVLNKLPKEVSGKLFSIDLKKYGISDCGKMGTRGFGVRNPYPGMEVFFSDMELVLARYPNSGAMNWKKTIDAGYKTSSEEKDKNGEKRGGTIEYSDSRHDRWANCEDVWLSGIFHYGWAYNCVKVKKINPEKKQLVIETALPYGVREHNFLELNAYFAYNLLEEIDSAGEYYIDRKNCVFYVMLDKRPSAGAYFDFSVINDSFVNAENAKYIEISNINFENTRGNALRFTNCSFVNVNNCNFKNLGWNAVSFDRTPISARDNQNPPLLSHHNTIENCSAVNTGQGGFSMNVGECINLQNGNGRIYNCYVSDNSRIGRSYCAGIQINGVGITVSHCRITNQTHMGIAHGGNDHIVEYNYFDKCATEFDDMGAFYTGRNQANCGNIIRYNFFAQITPKKDEAMMCGVYIDDGSGRFLIEKNIFCRVGNPGKNNHFGTVFFHGGDGNIVKDNIFVDCLSCVSCSVWSNENWNKRIKDNLYKIKGLVDIESEIYLKKYPKLKDVMNAERVRENFVQGNLFCNSNLTQRGKFTLENNKYITPNNGNPLPKVGYWTPEEFKKYFGENKLAKEIMSKNPGQVK